MEDNNKVELEVIWEGVDWGRCSSGQRKCLSVCCERGKDPAGSITRGKFLDKLWDCYLFKENCTTGEVNW